MKFKKESLLDFLRSIKNGSASVVEAIQKIGQSQKKLGEEILFELRKKKETETTISDSVKIIEPVEIKKPSWIGSIFPSITQIVEGFALVVDALSPIKKILERLEKKEGLTLPLTKDGRIMVEVDRVGGGGGSRGPAPLGKQEDSLFEYKLARLPVDGDTFIYLGYLNKDGGWYITEIDEANGTQTYAKGSDDFPSAWSSRAGLAYGEFNEVF